VPSGSRKLNGTSPMDSVKSGESSPVSASHRVSGIRRVRCSERHSLNLCRGRSLEAVAAASVYATTRCNGLGRSRAEVAACARCDQQQLTNAYTAMNVELELPTQPIAATDGFRGLHRTRGPRSGSSTSTRTRTDGTRTRTDDRSPAEWRRSGLSLSRCSASRILSLPTADRRYRR